MKKETGGPAFPTSHSADYPNEIVGGITTRDYFAAKAMQGAIANMSAEADFTSVSAEWTYKIADMMLKAREA